MEILDRYYCKFKQASTSYQSFIVVGLESEKVSLFSFSRSAGSWRSGPRLPRILYAISGGLIENIFTIIGGWDGDGGKRRKEVGLCCVVRRVCFFLVCWKLVVFFIVSIPNCFDDTICVGQKLWHVDC